MKDEQIEKTRKVDALRRALGKRATGAWLHGLTAEDREDVTAAIRRLTNERRAVQRRETERTRKAHPASARREAHGAVAAHAQREAEAFEALLRLLGAIEALS